MITTIIIVTLSTAILLIVMFTNLWIDTKYLHLYSVLLIFQYNIQVIVYYLFDCLFICYCSLTQVLDVKPAHVTLLYPSKVVMTHTHSSTQSTPLVALTQRMCLFFFPPSSLFCRKKGRLCGSLCRPLNSFKRVFHFRKRCPVNLPYFLWLLSSTAPGSV